MILGVWGAQEWLCGMTLHLLILEGAGVDAPLDASDYVSWAKQKWAPDIQDGLTSAGTSDHFFVHGDAERQRDKAGTRVTLKSLQWLPPGWLSPEKPFSSYPDSVFLFSGHIIFLTFFLKAERGLQKCKLLAPVSTASLEGLILGSSEGLREIWEEIKLDTQ